MSFGEVALAGAFLKESEFKGERKYPLSLEFCDSCSLAQVGQHVAARKMFDDYFYFTSAIGTMRKHFAHMADALVSAFRPRSVLEIGCNDGALLKPLAALGVERIVGVDPASNVTAKIDDARIEIVSAYYGKGVVDGKFDLIVANNVMAHVEDLNATVAAVAGNLAPDGVFAFEVNRLDALVSGLQYDWVYHEHRYYFSALALAPLMERHGLELFDASLLGTHAGSARYFAAHKGSREFSSSRLGDHIDREMWHGLFLRERMETFADAARDHRDELRGFVLGCLAAGKTVAGYGACGRTNTMLQFAGLDASHIAYIVDDAPAKHGFFTPGSHIPIRPSSALAEQPDALIVFAWSFLAEILGKCGDFKGQIVIPLPEIYTVQERIAA